MKLYKQVPSPHFVYWNATGMLLAARASGSVQMLALGERLVKRALDSRLEKGARPSAEEFRLYVLLLREQGKTSEALAATVAHGEGMPPLGTKGVSAEGAKIADESSLESTGVPSEFLLMQPSERLELEAELRLETGDAAGALACLVALSENSPEQWSFHEKYLDAVVDAEPWEGQVDAQIGARGRCWALQDSLPHARSPWLLELELLKRWGSKPLPAAWVKEKTTTANEISRLLLAYVERFSTKLCCFLDVQPYLSAAGASLLPALDALFAACVPPREGDLADRIRLLHKHICCAQCRRFLGAHEGVGTEVLFAEAGALFGTYQATLDVNDGAKGGQREVQHGDELVLLAGHILADAAAQLRAAGGDSRRCLVDAALILEFGIAASPYNSHLKIFLMQVYEELGAFQPAVALFKELRIRYVQLDSLSFLLLPGCASSGLFADARRQCVDMVRFHRTAARDAGEFCAKAHEKGNWTKAIELAGFQQGKMETSLALHGARADAVLYELLLHKHAHADALEYLEEVAGGARPESPRAYDEAKLSANQDWGVRASFVAPGEEDPSHQLIRQLARHRAVANLLRLCLRGEPFPATDVALLKSTPAEPSAALSRQELPVEKMVSRLVGCLFEACSKLDDPSAAVPLFESLIMGLAELSTALSDIEGQLVWLKSSSSAVELSMPLVLALCAAADKVSPRKKGKKGKKKASGAEDDGGASPLGAAIKQAKEAAVTLFEGLCSKFQAPNSPGASFEATIDASGPSAFPGVGTDAAFESARGKLSSGLASSWKASSTQLGAILKEKISILSDSI